MFGYLKKALVAHWETSLSQAAVEHARISAVAQACSSCTEQTRPECTRSVRNTPAGCSKGAALILHEGVRVSEYDALYPVQLEEAFDLLTFSSGAAHQQVAELIHRS